jgi:S-adenosylmethionine:tRNA ribosyltransferase-isomerase
VIPARIIARKPSGGKIDILLLRQRESAGDWEILSRGRFEGKIRLDESVEAEVWTEAHDNGITRNRRFLRFFSHNGIDDQTILRRYGSMPLPPYIKRLPDEEDKARYQTVYAVRDGSIAAPTAGLHFTEKLLNELRSKGVKVRTVTLHVGIGTFKPLRVATVEDHRMDQEYFEIDATLINEIMEMKGAGGKLFTVGTTTTRAIEGLLNGKVTPCGKSAHAGEEDKNYRAEESAACVRGYTDIFIYPGYRFKAVDALITNFHLPCSTPLMLVSAFSGFENIMNAYREAIRLRYRFFSYGDAMLIL